MNETLYTGYLNHSLELHGTDILNSRLELKMFLNSPGAFP